MTYDITVSKHDDVYMHIDAESGIKMEIAENFSFEVPGAKWMPAYKSGVWDGVMRLFNPKKAKLYLGLTHQLYEFSKKFEYNIKFDDSLISAEDISYEEAKEFIEQLMDSDKDLRDYQVKAFLHAIRYKRALILSPTASGKSFIIHSILQWLGLKTLVIVPTTQLSRQMKSDFVEYGVDIDSIDCYNIDKKYGNNIVISTWQSLIRLNKEWFNQFDCVVVDEAHGAKAKSITKIMESMVDCEYKLAFTGTIDDSVTSAMVLEGLFGKTYTTATTKELIDQGHVSDLKIKCLLLKYSKELAKDIIKKKYQEEMDYIVQMESRNRFIKNLVLSLKGNTIVLFQYVEKHGEKLYEMIKEKGGDRKVFFIHGGVDSAERDEMRAIVEQESNAIIVASYGTMSTGTNIKSLSNLVLASPGKSKIRILQSIGRSIRLHDQKEIATIFDIADDFSYNSKTNTTLNHFMERVKIYNKQKFKYKLYNIKMKD